VNNPFNMTLTALWDMLLAHPQFLRDVKEQNRIRFDVAGNRDPLKGSVQTGDLPEVCIATSAVTANVMETSSTSMCRRTYTIMISSGDYRYTEILGAVEWQIWVALCGWKRSFGALKWNGQSFIKKANVTTANQGLSNPEQNRNIRGWSSVWSVEVEMHFNTADLLAELMGDRTLEN
jgi:hypothetical protein